MMKYLKTFEDLGFDMDNNGYEVIENHPDSDAILSYLDETLGDLVPYSKYDSTWWVKPSDLKYTKIEKRPHYLDSPNFAGNVMSYTFVMTYDEKNTGKGIAAVTEDTWGALSLKFELNFEDMKSIFYWYLNYKHNLNYEKIILMGSRSLL